VRKGHPKHISDEKILLIYKDFYVPGETFKSIAIKYGVSALTVKRIVFRQRPRYKKLLE
jgi:hypothetical protein